MPSFSMTKTWADDQILNESDLDNIKTDTETFFNVTKLDSVNIQTGGVLAANLATDSVETVKIKALAVTAAKINVDVAGNGLEGGGGSALSVNVDDSTIEINSDEIRVKDLGITRPKLSSLGEQVSGGSGSFTTTNPGRTDVTNLSVTITTTGRPVTLFLKTANGLVSSYLRSSSTGASPATYFDRDGTQLNKDEFRDGGTNNRWPPGMFRLFDSPGAGTFTYKFQVSISGLNTIEVNNVVLVAYEL